MVKAGIVDVNKDAYFPRPYFDNGKIHISTRYLQNASYLRLKNFQIGYTLPWILPQEWYFKARFFVSGENLLTFTKMLMRSTLKVLDLVAGMMENISLV